jgi:ABC-type molybdate transport system permease subunit
MTTFVDLYFPPNMPVGRDEIQAAIEEELGSVVEVVGAGTGETGSNLDLEVVEPVDMPPLLAALAVTFARLGLPGETLVAVSEPPERVTLVELRRRCSIA